MAKIKKYQIGGYVVNQYGDTLRGKAAAAERARQKDYENWISKESPGSKIKPESKSESKSTPKTAPKPAPKKAMKKGGKIVKAKSKKGFPDLNKDGKITKADVLVGRGIIKKGVKGKKATTSKSSRAAKPKMKMGGKCRGGCY